MPSIRVEFYGIPRSRAGTASVSVEVGGTRELLERLADDLPEFGRECLDNGRLRPEYLLNINGRLFTREDDRPLHPGDAVLILSADAGG